MLILGIETSCDETAMALVADGQQVRANIVSSQIAAHARYGGVIPELAAREHLRALQPVLTEALAKGGVTLAEVDAVAVTHAPGLIPALLVGLTYAKGLALALDRPFIAINHMLAHVYGAFLDQPERLRDPASYPVLALIVSGGHTLLLRLDADGGCAVLGQTLDDASGEAFDKAAKVLNLGYPGGPVIDRLAKTGDPRRFAFPRGLTPAGGSPMAPENRLNFSFSGLKTSLLHHLRRHTGAAPDADPAAAATQLSDADLRDTVASYQEAVVDVLARKTLWAVEDIGARTVVLCGGVACNSRLRAVTAERLAPTGVPLFIAPPRYCTDNGAMIAGLAFHYLRRGLTSPLDTDALSRFVAAPKVPFTAVA